MGKSKQGEISSLNVEIRGNKVMKRNIINFTILIILCSLSLNADPKEDLFEAVRDGNIIKVRSMVSKAKLSLDYTDAREMTPLMIASTDNNLEMVKILAEAGADINKKNPENGKSSLMYAAANGHADIVRYLSTYKNILINAKDKEGKTSLMHAVISGRKDVVQLLIESNANVNARTNSEESALGYALKTGRAEIIALLRAVGARE